MTTLEQNPREFAPEGFRLLFRMADTAGRAPAAAAGTAGLFPPAQTQQRTNHSGRYDGDYQDIAPVFT